MSLTNYQELQQKNSDDTRFFGVNLPELQAGHLTIQAEQCAFEYLASAVSKLSADQGWLMYRDGLIYSEKAPVRTDFIEGEWCNSSTTIKAKLLSDNCYLVTTMELSQDTLVEQAMCFNVQATYLSTALTEANCVKYLHWYQLATTSPNEGRWLPFAQQFVGFTQHMEGVA